MASAKPYNACLHAGATQTHLINVIGTRLLTTGLFTKPLVFIPANLSHTESDFQAANDLLTLLISQAKGDTTKTHARDEQAIVVHDMEVDLCADVNKVAKHDRNIIGMSGFDETNQPEPTVKPGEPIIKKITEDKQPAGWYKAFLAKEKKATGPLTAKKANLHTGVVHYTIKSSLSNNGPWTVQLEDAASTKLIFTGLVVGQKNYIIIIGANRKGKGPPSKPFPFTPQIP
ncbi:MAG: fibronectin type III domain-containing protein [Bacteroidia bacterium]